MDHIKWDHTFSIGVDEIDSQHKIWIQTLNDMHVALSLGNSGNLIRETNKAVKTMYEYTCSHFKTEEAYMESVNYPDLLSHKALHDEFSSEILEIYNDVQEGKHVLSSEIMKRLTTWLQEHILQVDSKIGLYLSRQHPS